MELSKVEQLLDAYFEGQTSEQEERELQAYFLNENIPDHLEIYRHMFSYFAQSKNEHSEEKSLVVKKPRRLHKWYGIAAMLVVMFGIGYFIDQNTMSDKKQQEALQAYWQTKEALNYISAKFNQSSENLSYISEFSDSAEKVFKVN